MLSKSELLRGQLKIIAPPNGVTGEYDIDVFLAAENDNYNNILDETFTSTSKDLYDVDDDGDSEELLYHMKVKTPIQKGVGLSVYSTLKGSNDNSFSISGNTNIGSVVDGFLYVEYNGATQLNGLNVVGIIPYEGDGFTQYGALLDNQKAILAAPIDISMHPNAQVFYNLNVSDDVNDPGWSSTYTPDAKAVKIKMPDDYAMVSGGNEKLEIPITFKVPTATTIEEVSNVLGFGALESRAYGDNIPGDGFIGMISLVKSVGYNINGNVFNDQNKNGIKDSTEANLENVEIQLFRLKDKLAKDKVLYSTKTDAQGNYYFHDGFKGVDLKDGSYQVQIINPNSQGIAFVFDVGNITTNEDGLDNVIISSEHQVVSSVSGMSFNEFNLNYVNEEDKSTFVVIYDSLITEIKTPI
ncbi:MAG: SdrD B-like domain-containing protein, partial [Bacilli bacterium]